MFGMTDLIVTLWLLPATLSIDLPLGMLGMLGMLGGWTIPRLAWKMAGTPTPVGARTERAGMVDGACHLDAA